MGDDSYFINQRAQIMALAARDAVPTISGWSAFPVAGGLMSYGTDLADAYRQVGLYAGKILKGMRPADLPVQQVVKIEMVVNEGYLLRCMSLFVAVSTALVDHRFVRYRVDSVAKVESCSATNFSRKQETRDDPRFVCPQSRCRSRR